MQLSSWLLQLPQRLRRNRPQMLAATQRRRLTRLGELERLETRALLTVSATIIQNELLINATGGEAITVRATTTTPPRVEVLSNGVRLNTLTATLPTSLQVLNITGGDGNNVINLSTVTSALFGAGLRITVSGGNGNDTITGSPDLPNSLLGNDGLDMITGGTRNDTLVGGDGNDSVIGGTGDDSVSGGNGNDRLDGGVGNDSLDGGDGPDVLLGNIGNDTMLGAAGNDSLLGGTGNDILNGGSGLDTLLGEDGNDAMLGGIDNDSLLGGLGLDTLAGEAGNEILQGEADNDSLNGGDGNDSLLCGDGNDNANGALGNDTVVGEIGNDILFGGGGNDGVFGDSQDSLQIGTGSDSLKGNSGNDTLNGGGGRDTLRGDEGDDLIRSGDTDTDANSTPTLRISDAGSALEGAAGQVPVTFTVSLSRPLATSISVPFTTVNASATGNSDFVTNAGTLVIPANSLSATITVFVNGDTGFEPDESFFVDISNVVGGDITRSRAQFVIRNDDLFRAIGPSPTQDGQVENLAPNNTVSGAIHVVLPHPTDADTLFVGGTNGGVWRTRNATAVNPTWVPLTDRMPSQSIGAMALDPLNPTRIMVGIGTFSSFLQTGGALTGALLSNDSGDNWQQLNDPLLVGENFSAVAVRGNVLLAASNGGSIGPAPITGGLFRSADSGATWRLVNGTGGLPAGNVLDMIGDPSNATRFYLTMSGIGLFRSDDSGVNWVNVSSSSVPLSAALTSALNNNAELAVGQNGRVYVGVMLAGQVAFIGFTDNQGGLWSRMDLPQTPEFGGAVNSGLQPRFNPGAQGGIHFSITVDPTDQNIVYVGGDRQDGDVFGPTGNFSGARDFSGRLFRGDTRFAATGASPSLQWAHLTHSNQVAQTPTGGTASGSAPHADSRDMAFLANGTLVESDDGGVFIRTNPRSNTGDWFGLNGNLQVTEFHDIAYDTVSNIAMGGAQDTGTPQQVTSGSAVWASVDRFFTNGGRQYRLNADGGDVAVATNTPAGSSTRYSSSQGLGLVSRQVFDATGAFVSDTPLALAPTGNGANIQAQFVTPLVANVVNGNRIVLAGFNAVYESLDQGDAITSLGATTAFGSAMAYGGFLNGVGNPDVLYVGTLTGRVLVRTAGVAAPVRSMTYPGQAPTGIALDGDNFNTAVVVDGNSVYMTTNAGTTWTNIRGNLSDSAPRSVQIINNATSTSVAVGGNTGVFLMDMATLGVWTELDTGLPTVPVFDMQYDRTDDALVIGTLGRGAFLFAQPSVGTTSNTQPPPAPAVVPTLAAAMGDSLAGGDGNDTIIGADGDDVIDGEMGDDSLSGRGGQDTLLTGSGNDITDGGDDDDELHGEQGNGTLEGGSGTNILILEPFANGMNTSTTLSTTGADKVEIRGTVGNDTFTVSQVGGLLKITTQRASILLSDSVRNVTLVGGDGNDTVTLTAIDHVLPVGIVFDLGAGNDRFLGQNAKSGRVPLQVLGGEGNDTLTGSFGVDVFDGGAGNDSLTGGDGHDQLSGGIGDDILKGGIGNDELDGGDGSDVLDGETGNDIVAGGDGNDSLTGAAGNDTLKGDNGNDSLFAGTGDDRLEGGTGDDSLKGNTGNDKLFGGDGNDTLKGDEGNDTISAGDGLDRVEGGDGNDLLAGGDGNDLMLGGLGTDTLLGDDGNDTMSGDEGNDTVLGGDGDDTVRGNSGTDKLAGGDGINDLRSNQTSEIDELFRLDAAVLSLLV